MRRFLMPFVFWLLAAGVGPAAFSQGVTFSPATLDFGFLPPKSRKELVVQVTAPSGSTCTVTSPSAYRMKPPSFTAGGGPTSVTVEFDNSAIAQKPMDVSAAGLVNFKCGSASAALSVKGGVAGSGPRAMVRLDAKGQRDGAILFKVAGDPLNAKGTLPCLDNAASTGEVGCNESVHVGATVTFEIQGSTRFLKFSGGTGSAASCNDATAKNCSFTLGASGATIVAEYRPPDPKAKVRLFRHGDGLGSLQGFVSGGSQKVLDLSVSGTSNVATLDFNQKIVLKASAAKDSVFAGFVVKKPAGITCPARADECSFDLKPEHPEYEVEATFKKVPLPRGAK